MCSSSVIICLFNISQGDSQTNSSELIWKSGNNINVEKEVAEKLFKLLNVLEENDDVQIVSSNFEVSDEILSSLTI